MKPRSPRGCGAFACSSVSGGTMVRQALTPNLQEDPVAKNDTDWPDYPHSPVAREEFAGFANSPVDEDGNVVDAREVESYDDSTEDGAERKRVQTTESSVVANKGPGPSTNGYPAAQVGGTEAFRDEAVQQEGTSDEQELEDADS